MSNINYQALRMAAENATPGEWCSDDYYGVIADAGLNANYYIASCSGPDNRANKRFIAAANPATVLALLDEREVQSKRIAELETNLAALAAENAGLNKFIVQSCYVFDGEQDDLILPSLHMANRELRRAKSHVQKWERVCAALRELNKYRDIVAQLCQEETSEQH